MMIILSLTEESGRKFSMIEVSYVESEGEPGTIERTEERMGGRLSSGVIMAGGMGSPILRGEVGLPHPIWGGSSGIE